MKRKLPPTKTVGLTKSAGYEIGARKTFNIAPQQAWDFLTSSVGRRIWLGPSPKFNWAEGTPYQTQDGTSGEIRVCNPGGHVRLTWQPKGWAKPSTVQVRLVPRNGKTVIAFHQEHLSGPAQRETMRKRWQKVLAELDEIFATKDTQ